MRIANELAPKKSGFSKILVEPASLPLRQDDPFVDCVWARVETESVNQSVAKVIITISLGTAEVTPRLLRGQVRLGLKRIKLRLCAEDGEIPHQDRWPEHEVETLIDVELTEEHRQRRGASSKSSTKAKVGATGATGEATTEGGDHVEEEGTARRKFSVGDWTIRSGGSETSAYWEFRAIRPKDEVNLRLVNREVASFLITGPKALITYSVEFMASDLRILGSQGLFTGRAGSDDVCKWAVALSLVRRALAADLRRAVELPSKVEEP